MTGREMDRSVVAIRVERGTDRETDSRAAEGAWRTTEAAAKGETARGASRRGRSWGCSTFLAFLPEQKRPRTAERRPAPTGLVSVWARLISIGPVGTP